MCRRSESSSISSWSVMKWERTPTVFKGPLLRGGHNTGSATRFFGGLSLTVLAWWRTGCLTYHTIEVHGTHCVREIRNLVFDSSLPFDFAAGLRLQNITKKLMVISGLGECCQGMDTPRLLKTSKVLIQVNNDTWPGSAQHRNLRTELFSSKPEGKAI